MHVAFFFFNRINAQQKRNVNTLYSVDREFDFLEFETVFKLSKTLLIPSVLVIITVVAFKCLNYEFARYMVRSCDFLCDLRLYGWKMYVCLSLRIAFDESLLFLAFFVIVFI